MIVTQKVEPYDGNMVEYGPEFSLKSYRIIRNPSDNTYTLAIYDDKALRVGLMKLTKVEIEYLACVLVDWIKEGATNE